MRVIQQQAQDNAAKAAVRNSRRQGVKRAPARRTAARVTSESIIEEVPPPPPAATRSSSLSRTPSPRSAKKAAAITTIEVAPGHALPLRGATETKNAIRNDFFVPVSCFACLSDDIIFCIADAEYFLCPCCQGLCPVEEGMEGKGGVGLGFTIEELEQHQWSMIDGDGSGEGY